MKTKCLANTWKSSCWGAVILSGFLAILLSGCGERKEAPHAAEQGTEKPRVATEPAGTPDTKRRPTFATESPRPAPPSPSPQQTTAALEANITTAPVVAEPTPTPPPIQHALAALEEIPITIVDHVTTEQVLKVQGAINDLELKYKAGNYIIGDAAEAAFLEKLEQFTKLAEEMLQAKTPEQLREKYRQLSEGLKLMDAEIMERYRTVQERFGNK